MNPLRRVRRIRRLARLVGLGLILAAISQEMAKPESERTWQGKIGGAIPYDLRPPTWDRIRRAYWNPEDTRLFTTRVFGVGWAVNLHRAGVLLEGAFRNMMGTSTRSSHRRSA